MILTYKVMDIQLGTKVAYDGRIYTIDNIDSNNIVTATSQVKTACGGTPTIKGDMKIFSNLMTF